MPSTSWRMDTSGTLTLMGEVDMGTARVLRKVATANPLINAVDCAGVTFIDTAGLDAIANAAGNRTLLIVRPSAGTSRLLDLVDRNAGWCRERCVLIAAS